MHTYIYNAREEAEMKFPCFFFSFAYFTLHPVGKVFEAKASTRERENMFVHEKEGERKKTLSCKKRKSM
jgi:hypothetical protein